MAKTRQNKVVTRLSYEVSNQSALNEYKKSIESLKKPLNDLKQKFRGVADVDFNKTDAGLRKLGANLTSFGSNASATANKVNHLKSSIDGIKSKTISLKFNTSNAPRLDQMKFTPVQMPHANIMRQNPLENGMQSSVSRMIRGFRQVEQSMQRVGASLTRVMQRIIGAIDKIKLKFNATINASRYYSELQRMIRSAERAGKEIRRHLNISSGGGGSSGHGSGHGAAGSNHSNSESEKGGFGGKFIANVGAFVAGTAMIKDAMTLRDTYVSSMRTLQFITGSIGKAKEAQQELLQVSKETHSSYEGTRDLFVSFQSIADKTKLSLKENVELTKTVQIASKMGGGNQTELAITQLEQAIKKGKMDQQDLHSIEMFSPGITGALAKGLDISIADLREKVHKGLKAEDIIKALQKVGPELAKMNAESDLTWDNVKHYAETTLLQIVGKITDAADGFNVFYSTAIKVIDYLKAAFDKLFDILTDYFGSSKEAAIQLQIALMSLGGGAVIAALIAFGSALAAALWPVTIAVASVFALIEAFRMLQRWADGESGILQTLFGDFNEVKAKLQPLFDYWKKCWELIKQTALPIMQSIREAVLAVAQVIWTVFSQTIGNLIGIVSEVIAAIGDMFGISGEGSPVERALNTLIEVFSMVSGVIKQSFSQIANLFSFMRDLLTGDMDEVWRKMQRGFYTVMSQFKDGFSVLFDTIQIAVMKTVQKVRSMLPTWLGGYTDDEQVAAAKAIADKEKERDATASKSQDQRDAEIANAHPELMSLKERAKADAGDEHLKPLYEAMTKVEESQKALTEERNAKGTTDDRKREIDAEMLKLNQKGEESFKQIEAYRKENSKYAGGKIDDFSEGYNQYKSNKAEEMKAKREEAEAKQAKVNQDAYESTPEHKKQQELYDQNASIGKNPTDKLFDFGPNGKSAQNMNQSTQTNNNINAPNNITNNVTVNAVSNDAQGIANEAGQAIGTATSTATRGSGIGALIPSEATGR